MQPVLFICSKSVDGNIFFSSCGKSLLDDEMETHVPLKAEAWMRTFLWFLKKTHYPVSMPQHTWFIWMARYQLQHELRNDLIICIRCVGAGKHRTHERQQATRHRTVTHRLTWRDVPCVFLPSATRGSSSAGISGSQNDDRILPIDYLLVISSFMWNNNCDF